MTRTIRFRRDEYKIARGRSVFLDLTCTQCKTFVALYQKDGPGPLKRIYLDRIFKPASLAAMAQLTLKKLKPLHCTKCKEELGVPMIYEKEGRLAYKLFESVITKKKYVASKKS